jgi:hypothetical protein
LCGACPASAIRERNAAAHPTLLPARPAAIPVNTAPRPRLPGVREALESPGQPLDEQTRAFVEPRFGRDFSAVRLHTDTRASDSASAVNALAYTAGNHIVFDRGRYAPETASGRRLLIHELAHVAQQGSRPAPLESDWQLGNPSSATERAADAAVPAVEYGPRMHGSVLSSQLAAMAPSQPILHRAVATWGGEWDTATYKERATKDGIEEIKLHFKPKDPVDATLIGVVQDVVSKNSNTVVTPDVAPDHTIKDRSLPAGPGEGVNIDQNAPFRNPLYATGAGKANDHLWDTPVETAPEVGTHGFHHRDGKGVLHEKDAVMRDTPQIPGAGPNSSQIFEDTALAVTGVQTGATYGSVQWGWKIDAAGKFSKLPLTKISDDAPSGTFKQAQSLWNKSKNSAGEDLIKFYTASGKFIQDADTPLVADPADAAKTEIAKLAKDTRVEMIDIGVGQKFNLPDPKAAGGKGSAPKAGAPKPQWHKITVTEGAEKGKTGWVLASQLANTKAKPPAAQAAP